MRFSTADLFTAMTCLAAVFAAGLRGRALCGNSGLCLLMVLTGAYVLICWGLFVRWHSYRWPMRLMLSAAALFFLFPVALPGSALRGYDAVCGTRRTAVHSILLHQEGRFPQVHACFLAPELVGYEWLEVRGTVGDAESLAELRHWFHARAPRHVEWEVTIEPRR